VRWSESVMSFPIRRKNEYQGIQRRLTSEDPVWKTLSRLDGRRERLGDGVPGGTKQKHDRAERQRTLNGDSCNDIDREQLTSDRQTASQLSPTAQSSISSMPANTTAPTSIHPRGHKDKKESTKHELTTQPERPLRD
jgi:hypothetical protein